MPLINPKMWGWMNKLGWWKFQQNPKNFVSQFSLALSRLSNNNENNNYFLHLLPHASHNQATTNKPLNPHHCSHPPSEPTISTSNPSPPLSSNYKRPQTHSKSTRSVREKWSSLRWSSKLLMNQQAMSCKPRAQQRRGCHEPDPRHSEANSGEPASFFSSDEHRVHTTNHPLTSSKL